MADHRCDRLVAVVEDDDRARNALGRLLEVGGFETVLFDSAESFIASRPPLDCLCLVLDIHLTGMSGIELQRRLRAEGSQLPIVMVTGSRADVVREYAERAGCVAFLLKPFSGETILALLASLSSPLPT